jgi:hypothetical protein
MCGVMIPLQAAFSSVDEVRLEGRLICFEKDALGDVFEHSVIIPNKISH